MHPNIIRLAYRLIDTEVTTQYAFTNDPLDPRDELSARRQALRTEVADMTHEDLCHLAEALTDLACISLHNMVWPMGGASYTDLAGALHHGRMTRSQCGFAGQEDSHPGVDGDAASSNDLPDTCQDFPDAATLTVAPGTAKASWATPSSD